MSDLLDDFVGLSAALTGFRAVDIYGTGLATTYFDTLTKIVGEDVLAKLLAGAGDIPTLLVDPLLGPVAQNVIVLWYLGQWDQLPHSWRNTYGANPNDVVQVIAPEGWTQALVWPAIGAHGMGAKPPGFGSWALPPDVSTSAPESA